MLKTFLVGTGITLMVGYNNGLMPYILGGAAMVAAKYFKLV
jgi:hypothetical protein